LPIEREDFGQGHSCALFDFAIELDEWDAEFLAKPGTERRFAGATQTDQRNSHSADFFFVTEVAHQPEGNVFEAVRRNTFKKALNQSLLDRLFGFGRKELDEGDIEGGDNAPEEDDRDVSFACFQLREMALGDIRFVRDHLASHAPAIANLAHARSEKKKKGALGSRGDCGVDGLGIGVCWHLGRG
jgi:hypothetical protein